jgi:Domain of unknown function (DUF397)
MDEQNLPQIPSELGAEWRKSRHSLGNGECIEVACGTNMVFVRDSRNLMRTHLFFTAPEWRSFTARTKQQN